MLNSFFSALLMYSRIPAPQVEWKEENRRYSLCLFPIIGVIIGLFFVLWNYISVSLGFGKLLIGAVSMLISYMITGGIHLDGFCDVSDAVSSYADKEKRLEIMKDSHVGAFAVIKLTVCLIVQTAVYSETVNFQSALIIASGFVISRILSAFAAVTFKCAKNNGSLQSFVRPSHKKITMICLAMEFLLTAAFIIICNFKTGIVFLSSALLVFGYYRLTSYKNFGGITGDTEGWFLVMCETVSALAAVVSERINL